MATVYIPKPVQERFDNLLEKQNYENSSELWVELLDLFYEYESWQGRGFSFEKIANIASGDFVHRSTNSVSTLPFGHGNWPAARYTLQDEGYAPTFDVDNKEGFRDSPREGERIASLRKEGNKSVSGTIASWFELVSPNETAPVCCSLSDSVDIYCPACQTSVGSFSLGDGTTYSTKGHLSELELYCPKCPDQDHTLSGQPKRYGSELVAVPTDSQYSHSTGGEVLTWYWSALLRGGALSETDIETHVPRWLSMARVAEWLWLPPLETWLSIDSVENIFEGIAFFFNTWNNSLVDITAIPPDGSCCSEHDWHLHLSTGESGQQNYHRLLNMQLWLEEWLSLSEITPQLYPSPSTNTPLRSPDSIDSEGFVRVGLGGSPVENQEDKSTSEFVLEFEGFEAQLS